MPEEAIFFALPLLLVISALVLGIVLLDRTLEPNPSRPWGCGRLALAWFGWGLFCLLAIALILPSTGGAPQAARRMCCSNNLKQIVLAMQNYADKYGCFPPAYTVDNAGRPLHSWRVLLLPFLEYQTLYERIRLDEPWDSPHNRALFQSVDFRHDSPRSIPEVFWCPSDRDNRGETNYVMIIGPRTISNGPNSVRFKDITDGTSKTIAVAETYGLGIHWYEPRDLRVEEMSFKINDPDYYSIASRHPGGAQVGLADGSVRFLPDDTDPRAVEGMTTINGGEDVSAALR